ncbi:hypothetical protein SLEP1_g4346 [Rubroshorea leprosula]|uniref:Uncharacterized protein n=1 Tax=Rubroshorea leprosula TaxID=152421 RepID=A0AAV5HUU7_9ROSI|nr:hypothetical protein SLEP1_g4346 [Rubroshorea leprosula]
MNMLFHLILHFLKFSFFQVVLLTLEDEELLPYIHYLRRGRGFNSLWASLCSYHCWALRTAVYAGMCTIPSRDQLLLRLNETDHAAEKKMRRYINTSPVVGDYIDQLHASRKISLDW